MNSPGSDYYTAEASDDVIVTSRTPLNDINQWGEPTIDTERWNEPPSARMVPVPGQLRVISVSVINISSGSQKVILFCPAENKTLKNFGNHEHISVQVIGNNYSSYETLLRFLERTDFRVRNVIIKSDTTIREAALELKQTDMYGRETIQVISSDRKPYDMDLTTLNFYTDFNMNFMSGINFWLPANSKYELTLFI